MAFGGRSTAGSHRRLTSAPRHLSQPPQPPKTARVRAAYFPPLSPVDTYQRGGTGRVRTHYSPSALFYALARPFTGSHRQVHMHRQGLRRYNGPPLPFLVPDISFRNNSQTSPVSFDPSLLFPLLFADCSLGMGLAVANLYAGCRSSDFPSTVRRLSTQPAPLQFWNKYVCKRKPVRPPDLSLSQSGCMLTSARGAEP